MYLYIIIIINIIIICIIKTPLNYNGISSKCEILYVLDQNICNCTLYL